MTPQQVNRSNLLADFIEKVPEDNLNLNMNIWLTEGTSPGGKFVKERSFETAIEGIAEYFGLPALAFESRHEAHEFYYEERRDPILPSQVAACIREYIRESAS